jgi:hypothetical protein
MIYDQQTELGAQTEENEPVLHVGMVRVMYEQSVIVNKYGLCLFKGYAVLPQI